jgi:DNA replication protein DnaC
MIEICLRLASIGMKLSADTLRALLEHASKNKLSHVQLLEQLVLAEAAERDARNLKRRSRAATLGAVHSLDKFDWNHPRAIDRPLFEQLYQSLDFINRGENILLRGQAGVGKTTLAQNLGLRALEHGRSVRFSSLSGALADLLQQESLPATERRLKRYTAPDLLILDELGYVPCDARAADLLFHIISRRHEKRAVVITTNLAFKHWGNTFQNAPCLSALIDRFAQHCHVIDIDADSCRDKQRLLRKKKKTTAPASRNKK